MSYGLILLDAYQDGGVKGSHVADAIITTGLVLLSSSLPVVGLIVAGVYLAVDVYVTYKTGKSITENVFDPKNSK